MSNFISPFSRCFLIFIRVLSVTALLAGSVFLRAQNGLQIQSLAVQTTQGYPATNGVGYDVRQTNIDNTLEHRCYFNGHHFLSVIHVNGALAIRPHPGVDTNGWGVSLYPQPFLYAATLRGSTASVFAASDHLLIRSSGLVSRGTSSSYGTWTNQLRITYSPETKFIQGTGTYSIRLSGSLSSATGDLSLAKIANSLLVNVPLLSGTNGVTGDMRYAMVGRSPNITNFTWDPIAVPGHFPGEKSDYLSIETTGAYNEVDTEAQGFNPIQAGYKPSLRFILASQNPGANVQFGGFFATSLATNFAADNIGITPIVAYSSTQTNFNFDVSIASTALPHDGIGIDAYLSATATLTNTSLPVRYAATLTNSFRQLAGNIPQVGTNLYSGRVRIPFPPDTAIRQTGFFLLKKP